MIILPSATEVAISLLARDNHKFIKVNMANRRLISHTCRYMQQARRLTVMATQPRPQQIRRMLGKRLNLLALIIANTKITMNRQSLWIRTWPLSPIEAFKTPGTSSNSIKPLNSTRIISWRQWISTSHRATHPGVARKSRERSPINCHSRQRRCSHPPLN